MTRRCDTCEWWAKRDKDDPDGDYTGGDCHLGTLTTEAYASHWCSHHAPMVKAGGPSPAGMFATARAPGWSRLRAAWLKAHPACAVCGRTGPDANCVPHHIVPVHVDASKELDDNNLVTLCESESVNCHLAFGHLWNWSRWNPHVVVDAREWHRKITQSTDLRRIPGFIPHDEVAIDLTGGSG